MGMWQSSRKRKIITPNKTPARYACLPVAIAKPAEMRAMPTKYVQNRWKGIHAGTSVATKLAYTKCSMPKRIMGRASRKRPDWRNVFIASLISSPLTVFTLRVSLWSDSIPESLLMHSSEESSSVQAGVIQEQRDYRFTGRWSGRAIFAISGEPFENSRIRTELLHYRSQLLHASRDLFRSEGCKAEKQAANLLLAQ